MLRSLIVGSLMLFGGCCALATIGYCARGPNDSVDQKLEQQLERLQRKDGP